MDVELPLRLLSGRGPPPVAVVLFCDSMQFPPLPQHHYAAHFEKLTYHGYYSTTVQFHRTTYYGLLPHHGQTREQFCRGQLTTFPGGVITLDIQPQLPRPNYS